MRFWRRRGTRSAAGSTSRSPRRRWPRTSRSASRDHRVAGRGRRGQAGRSPEFLLGTMQSLGILHCPPVARALEVPADAGSPFLLLCVVPQGKIDGFLLRLRLGQSHGTIERCLVDVNLGHSHGHLSERWSHTKKYTSPTSRNLTPSGASRGGMSRVWFFSGDAARVRQHASPVGTRALSEGGARMPT